MASRPTASIIIIGDEILKGQTIDTNSHFLCRELYKFGVKVARISVIPDDIDIIAEEVCLLSEKNTFVFTSGGIGPTHDDLTYEGIAKAFNEKLVLNKSLQKILVNLCTNMGLDETAAYKMSHVPESSEIRHIYSKKKISFPVVSVKNVFTLSGIPSYLEYAFSQIKSVFKNSSVKYVCQTLYVNSSEFCIMDVLNSAVKEFDGSVKFGSYPDVENLYYQVKLTLEGDTEESVANAEAFLRSHLPHNTVVGQLAPSSDKALLLLEDALDNKSKNYNNEFANAIQTSLNILEECFAEYPLHKVCLSFNGGKDCTALLHLTHLSLAKLFPERSAKLKVLYVRSKQPFTEIENFIELSVERYNLELIAYNLPIKDALMQLKSDHPEISVTLMGSRNTDPRCSNLKTFQMTDPDWPQFMRVNPLISWTYQQVWELIRNLEVPYCSLYDRGMDAAMYSVKHLTLGDMQKVITSLGDFAEISLNAHSLAMLVGKTGEVAFTSCGWRLLSESDFSYPLTKVISNAVLNYTKLCGDDCKYFLFILREVFTVIRDRTNEADENLTRRKLIDEICLLKQALPCIFRCVQHMPGVHKTDSNSFFGDLLSVAFAFLSNRFSVSVSMVLCHLICDFIKKMGCESVSSKISLQYIISHFDVFCCKLLSPLAESKVSEGFLLCSKSARFDFSVKNVKFIVIWDLSTKLQFEKVSWKITDESFTSQLNSSCVYQKVFQYFKSLNITLILTPSICDNSLKIQCEKNDIFIFDRLETDEVECLLLCCHLSALESLNECLESQQIGELKFAKLISHYKSNFLHLCFANSERYFSVHHILLSAPCDIIWKEYYSECLNCFKMIHQWLKADACVCVQENLLGQINLNKSTQKSVIKEVKSCICCKLAHKIKDKFESVNSDKSQKKVRFLFPPGLWETLFKNKLEDFQENLSLSFGTVFQALHLATVKSLCKRIGIPFAGVKDIENACAEFIEKGKLHDIYFLESAVCKEIMIFNILDLVLQLLKIESIVFAQ